MHQHEFVLDIEDLSERTDEENANAATDTAVTAEAVIFVQPPL